MRYLPPGRIIVLTLLQQIGRIFGLPHFHNEALAWSPVWVISYVLAAYTEVDQTLAGSSERFVLNRLSGREAELILHLPTGFPVH